MNIFNRLLVIVINLAVLGAATLLILLTANLVMPEQLTTWSWLLARIQAIDAFAARHQVTTVLVSSDGLVAGVDFALLRVASRLQIRAATGVAARRLGKDDHITRRGG